MDRQGRDAWLSPSCGATLARMTLRMRLVLLVLATLSLRADSASADTFDYSVACDQVVLGPTTLLATTAFPFTGTLDLTPNVAASDLAVLTAPSLHRVDDNTATSGTFMGTLSCTLTLGGVSVGYTRSLSLTIAVGGPCAQAGKAGGCIVTGPVTVEVHLPATVGSVELSAPQQTTFGYDAQLGNGGLIVVPAALVDTAELTCTADSGCLERCDDCVDDNGDGLVDYDDPDCQARADGNGAGSGSPKPEGKALVKCGKALQAAGSKLASARVKHLQKCLGATFACVQLKPNDDACVAKAKAACAKELGAVAKDRATLAAKVGKACAAPAVALAALQDATGVGYAHESERCAAHGVGTLGAVADVAACVARLHECDAEAAVGFEMPRAAELLAFADRDPVADAPCLPHASSAFTIGLADPTRAQAAAACAKAIAKSGAGFLGAKQKLVQKCASAVTVCVQTKPGDAACLTKAASTCSKAIAKIGGPTGIEAKLAAGVLKKCSGLSAADLTGTDGLGFQDRSGDCTALGGPLASATDVAACLVRQHECRAERMLESQTPRLRELLDLAGVALPGDVH